MYVSIFEWIVDFLIEALFDFLAEHIDVGFVDVLAFLDEGHCIVNVDVLQF